MSDPQELAKSTLAERPWTSLPPALGTAMRPVLPELTEEIIEAVRTQVPAYRRPLEGSFGMGVRTGVEEALGQFVDMVENPDEARDTRREVYGALGAGEAREGRTLDALLSAYRIGTRVAWRRIAVAALEAGVGDERLALLAESIFAYIDEISALSAEGFARAQYEAASDFELRRRRLVTTLLADPPPEDHEARAEARHAVWDPPRSLAALVWHDTGARSPRLPAGTITGRLRDDIRCALIPDPEGPGRSGEIERGLGKLTAALGPATGWLGAASSARRAAAALTLADRGVLGPGLVRAADHMGDLVTHADPGLVEDLADRALAPLDQETPASRERLAMTLRAWLDHQGSAGAVAEALHVHPQTVRYRLARLRERFGERLEDPDFRFELALALRAREGAA